MIKNIFSRINLFAIGMLLLIGYGNIIEVKASEKIEVINGYSMPPAADKKINNSTLLGIDFNNNGIRDDVERMIILENKNNHKITTATLLQTARAYQKAIEIGKNADKDDRFLLDAMDCAIYVRFKWNIVSKTNIKSLQLNTKSRLKSYLKYDRQFGGGIYGLTPLSKSKAKCTFDVDAFSVGLN